MKKKLFGLVAIALAVVIGAAQAETQTYDDVTKDAGFGFSVRESSRIASTTTISDAPVNDTRGDMEILLSANTDIGVAIVRKLKDGTVVSTTTISATTTPKTVTFDGPLKFQKVAISPTTIGTSNNYVDAHIIQSRQ